MKQVQATWKKSMTVTFFAPEDMSDEDIANLAQHASDAIDRGFNPPEWQTSVDSVSTVEVPDEERTVEVARNKYGFPSVVARGRFNAPDRTVEVVSDDRMGLVPPAFAKWWALLGDEKQS
jgi:hypothetical protein